MHVPTLAPRARLETIRLFLGYSRANITANIFEIFAAPRANNLDPRRCRLPPGCDCAGRRMISAVRIASP